MPLKLNGKIIDVCACKFQKHDFLCKLPKNNFINKLKNGTLKRIFKCHNDGIITPSKNINVIIFFNLIL